MNAPPVADDRDNPLEWPRTIRGWTIYPMLVAIRFYQLGVRPFLPGVCRFHPSCSRYSVEAFRIHGVIRGSLLTTWRLLRCNPLCRSGYDPVPPPRSGRERA